MRLFVAHESAVRGCEHVHGKREEYAGNGHRDNKLDERKPFFVGVVLGVHFFPSSYLQ